MLLFWFVMPVATKYLPNVIEEVIMMLLVKLRPYQAVILYQGRQVVVTAILLKIKERMICSFLKWMETAIRLG